MGLLRTNYTKNSMFFALVDCSIVIDSGSIAGLWLSNLTVTTSMSTYGKPNSLLVRLVDHAASAHWLRWSVCDQLIYITCIDIAGSFESLAASDSYHFQLMGLIGSLPTVDV